MIIYSPHTSTRLQYMADWLGLRLTGSGLPIVHTKNWSGTDHVLNYSDENLPGTYQILPAGLLHETGVRPQEISLVNGDLPYFFTAGGDHPFDILSAGFYLLSRYEEYLPHTKDMYGRYAHENSLAFKNGFIKRPLIDEWIIDLKLRLESVFAGISFTEPSFRFIPTYDVDIAWSYRGKSFGRQLGGAVKAFLKGNWKALEERRKVANIIAKDPFDIFEDLDALHMRYNLEPQYFFLLAEKLKGYDRNISPHNIAFQNLINELSESYHTGIHLSWQSCNEPTVMQKEINLLEQITGRQVTSNRMHYIRFDLPDTFRQLIGLGIESDFSMGYGSINGFRASTSIPYHWYDLHAETITDLLLYPFCYMEANSIFEQKDDPGVALAEIKDLYKKVQHNGGAFVCIFHNHLINRHAEGRAWWNVYKSFLQNIIDSFDVKNNN